MWKNGGNKRRRRGKIKKTNGKDQGSDGSKWKYFYRVRIQINSKITGEPACSFRGGIRVFLPSRVGKGRDGAAVGKQWTLRKGLLQKGRNKNNGKFGLVKADGARPNEPTGVQWRGLGWDIYE